MTGRYHLSDVPSGQSTPLARNVKSTRMKIKENVKDAWRRQKDWRYRNRKRTVVVSWMPRREFTLRGIRKESTIDRSLNVYALYEPYLVKKILEVVSHSDKIYDVGSELGYYAKLFSEIIGASYVTAFEPNSRALYWLNRNLPKRVKVEKKFVGASVPEVYREGSISLDKYINSQDWKRWPTVLKLDVEGAEAPIILESDYIQAHRPRLFLEIHPTEIKENFQVSLDTFFERLTSLYQVEMLRNHWGIVKIKGPLSVVDQVGSNDWQTASVNDLMRVSSEIIERRVQPLCFALHCFVPLDDVDPVERVE